MKAIFAITILITSAAVTWVTADVQAGDAWYNASGKVVKVTPVQKEKERFVPAWEKREAIRNSGREARWDRGYSGGWVERTRSTYYGGYGWNPYSSCRSYGGYYGYSNHHHGGYSSFRFNGAYRKNGWSLRVKF